METQTITERTNKLVNRQKVLVVWTGIVFALLFFHMVLDPILHWT
ncbi:MAG: hypothetical protein ACXAD7_23625 [Candidatus Kariarchaeaceae archaeon]